MPILTFWNYYYTHRLLRFKTKYLELISKLKTFSLPRNFVKKLLEKPLPKEIHDQADIPNRGHFQI